MAGLKASGHTFEQDGALWLRTTDFGDDKDRVMKKATGGYTYFVPDVAYHVSKWFEFWNAGYNLWRLKIWIEPSGSLRYRIVYAYEPRTLQYHVLAIVHRDFDYKKDHDITRRIRKAYNDLGLTIH